MEHALVRRARFLILKSGIKHLINKNFYLLNLEIKVHAHHSKSTFHFYLLQPSLVFPFIARQGREK